MPRSKSGPGRAHREGISDIELFAMFPDDAAAEAWFEAQRWPNGRFCPDCGSTDTIDVKRRRPMPYRCRTCRGYFSVRKGTVMEGSKIGLQKWVVAIYKMTTNLTGVSSMQIKRSLKVRQTTAWHLMHRIREGFLEGAGLPLHGPVEVDETYIGGKRKNMHASKRRRQPGRGGPSGKTVVVGARDRATRRVTARVLGGSALGDPVWSFIRDAVPPGSTLYTDNAKLYKGARGRGYEHESVNHSAGEYVRGDAHTNGVESFWAALKRAIAGTYHHLSEKHLERYVQELAGRHNVRDLDTIDQMRVLARGMVGRRLRYRDLIA